MPEDILHETAPRATFPRMPQRHKISAIAVILTVILAISLILLGERIIFDLNRVANPMVEKYSPTSSNYGYRSGYEYERNLLSDVAVYYPQEKRGEYLLYKTLLHSAFIIPAFLLTFLFYYMVFLKMQDNKYKVLVGGYLAFAFWMILRLLIELAHFIIVQYKSAAVYIILVVLVLLFTGLVVVIQRKMAQREVIK